MDKVVSGQSGGRSPSDRKPADGVLCEVPGGNRERFFGGRVFGLVRTCVGRKTALGLLTNRCRKSLTLKRFEVRGH